MSRELNQVIINELLKFGLLPDQAIECAMMIRNEINEYLELVAEKKFEEGYMAGRR